MPLRWGCGGKVCRGQLPVSWSIGGAWVVLKEKKKDPVEMNGLSWMNALIWFGYLVGLEPSEHIAVIRA